MGLHLYFNETDWFAAETLEQARELAVLWYRDMCDLDEEDIVSFDYLDFTEVRDDKELHYYNEDGDDDRYLVRTAGEFAAENGPGFWGSTEF